MVETLLGSPRHRRTRSPTSPAQASDLTVPFGPRVRAQQHFLPGPFPRRRKGDASCRGCSFQPPGGTERLLAVLPEVARSNRRVFPTSRPAEVACVCAGVLQLQSPAPCTLCISAGLEVLRGVRDRGWRRGEGETRRPVAQPELRRSGQRPAHGWAPGLPPSSAVSGTAVNSGCTVFDWCVDPFGRSPGSGFAGSEAGSIPSC